MELIDRETVSGKPHGGTWIGKCLILNNPEFCLADAERILRACIPGSLPSDLEFRNETVIHRPLQIYGMFVQNATLSIKGIVWGRAFKVHRLFKKGAKAYKKVWSCGKRKRKRIR